MNFINFASIFINNESFIKRSGIDGFLGYLMMAVGELVNG
jgi:hypothetical protein